MVWDSSLFIECPRAVSGRTVLALECLVSTPSHEAKSLRAASRTLTPAAGRVHFDRVQSTPDERCDTHARARSIGKSRSGVRLATPLQSIAR